MSDVLLRSGAVFDKMSVSFGHLAPMAAKSKAKNCISKMESDS